MERSLIELLPDAVCNLAISFLDHVLEGRAAVSQFVMTQRHEFKYALHILVHLENELIFRHPVVSWQHDLVLLAICGANRSGH